MVAAIDSSVIDKIGLSRQEKKHVPQNELGGDAFMKLVLAQLQNQDPLNPAENGEFLAQLAQMESVNGLQKLQTSFNDFATSFQSNQALQASSMVGRWVLVPSQDATVWPDMGMKGSVEVPTSSEQVLVSIMDGAGQIIHQIDLGAQKGGLAEFNWDGVGVDGEPVAPGSYKIEATASIAGEFEAVKTLIASPVESVTLNRGGAGMTLNVYDVGSVSLSDVQEVM